MWTRKNETIKIRNELRNEAVKFHRWAKPKMLMLLFVLFWTLSYAGWLNDVERQWRWWLKPFQNWWWCACAYTTLSCLNRNCRKQNCQTLDYLSFFTSLPQLICSNGQQMANLSFDIFETVVIVAAPILQTPQCDSTFLFIFFRLRPKHINVCRRYVQMYDNMIERKFKKKAKRHKAKKG